MMTSEVDDVPMSAEPKLPESTSRCIVCRSEIPSDARICVQCSSYQQPWRNGLRFWSTSIGFIAFVLAAASYLAEQTPTILKTIFPPVELELVSLRSDGIALSNKGLKDIFITNVQMNYGTATGFRYLSATIAPGTIGFVPFTEETSPHDGDGYEVVGSSSGLTGAEVLDIASHTTLDSCRFITFMDMSDHGSEALLEKGMASFPARAIISYHSLQSNTDQRLEFDANTFRIVRSSV